MNTMNERIRQLRLKLNLSQAVFGSHIGMSRDEIKNIEYKKTTLKDNKIPLICSAFNVSEEWLRNGEGDMFIELSKDADFLQIMTQIQVSNDELIKSILSAYWELDDTKKAAIKELIDSFIKKYNDKSKQ